MEKIVELDWKTLIIGFLVLIDLYNVIVKAIQNHRAETKTRNGPMRTLEERMDAYDAALAEINRKIETLEHKDTEHVTESRLVLRGLLALTRHSLDGNNIEGLKSYQQELQTYLVDK